MYDAAVAISFQLMVFLLFYAAFRIKKDHAPLQLLFFAMGFFAQIINLDILRQVAEDAGKTGIAATIGYAYNAMIYITVFVLFYLILVFLTEAYKRMKLKGDE